MTTRETDYSGKHKALAAFLECEPSELEESRHDASAFEQGSREYLVLTDSEADEKAREYIVDSLWAFNASFLASYTGLPDEVFTALQDKCEGANDTFRKLVERADGGIDGLIAEAISADGRGHFLNNYDGNENEQGEFFIYQIN